MAQKSKIRLYLILKWTLAIFLGLFIITYFLNQGFKSKYCRFQRLDKDSIESGILYRFIPDSIPHSKDSLILTKYQINRIVNKWNNSYPIGPCKFIPKYTLTFKMTNGNNRFYRMSSKTIKDQYDFGFQFVWNDNFFETIWNEK